MTHDDLTSPVTAAAIAQVKLWPYDEEEPHIWFHLIKAQFAAAGIKSQRLKYANTLALLPKRVLQDILDTFDVCNNSAEPFDFLKHTLLGQYRKSKWQSYFELHLLPMEMQGLKPSVLMGKLKQNLPPGVSPDNDLFLSVFLIRLLSSMRETVGAGTHETAAAMVKAADALWDAWGSHDPLVAAASTQRSRSPAPSSGKIGDKRSGNARSKKSRPTSRPDFYSFQNPGNGVCKFHNYYAHKAHSCALPCAWSENWLAAEPLLVLRAIQHTPLPRICISPQVLDWFFSRMNWQMIGIWLILEQHWALFLATKMLPHLAPSSKGQMGNLSPIGVSLKKTAISRQTFHIQFFARRCGWSHSGHWLLRKFKVTVVPEINQIQFACTAAALPAPYLPSAASPAPSLLSAASSTSSSLPTSTLVPAPVQIQLPAAMTSSQAPAISTHVQ